MDKQPSTQKKSGIYMVNEIEHSIKCSNLEVAQSIAPDICIINIATIFRNNNILKYFSVTQCIILHCGQSGPKIKLCF